MTEAKWYIIHAHSNFEHSVARAIREQAARSKLVEMFEEIEVPTDEIQKIHGGTRRKVQQRRFPGYVLIKMHMTDSTYHLIKTMPKVSGFLGAEGGKKPIAVPQSEIDNILGHDGSDAERMHPLISFELGERVMVNDGPFNSFEGSVQGIDEEAGRLKVTVSIFGRETPVDLKYEQVEKL